MTSAYPAKLVKDRIVELIEQQDEGARIGTELGSPIPVTDMPDQPIGHLADMRIVILEVNLLNNSIRSIHPPI